MADLDINPNSLPFDADTELSFLSAGFNSKVYVVGNLVLKVSQDHLPAERALRLTQTMYDEHSLMAEYIGGYMPETVYHTLPTRNNPYSSRVVIVQDRVDGPSLPNCITKPHVRVDGLVELYESCIRMREQTGKIPDVANIQDGFNVFKNTNIVMGRDECGWLTPHQTETSFGKIQRSKALGPIWSTAIALGVRRGLAQLEGTGF